MIHYAVLHLFFREAYVFRLLYTLFQTVTNTGFLLAHTKVAVNVPQRKIIRK